MWWCFVSRILQELNTVHKDKDPRCVWFANGAGDYRVNIGGEVFNVWCWTSSCSHELRQWPSSWHDGLWREVPATGATSSPVAAALGPSSGVAAGLVCPGSLGVALPCASAKRSRLLPEVFDERSLAFRAIIREVNETFFAHLTGGVVGSESRERVGYSFCLLTWRHLLFAFSTLLFLTSGHQVVLSPARQLSTDWSRAVRLEVIRWLLMILLRDR